jgi:hypothetical protein
MPVAFLCGAGFSRHTRATCQDDFVEDRQSCLSERASNFAWTGRIACPPQNSLPVSLVLRSAICALRSVVAQRLIDRLLVTLGFVRSAVDGLTLFALARLLFVSFYA